MALSTVALSSADGSSVFVSGLVGLCWVGSEFSSDMSLELDVYRGCPCSDLSLRWLCCLFWRDVRHSRQSLYRLAYVTGCAYESQRGVRLGL